MNIIITIFLNWEWYWCWDWYANRTQRLLRKENYIIGKEEKRSRTITKHFKWTSPNTCVHAAWQLIIIIRFIKSRTIPNPKCRWLMTHDHCGGAAFLCFFFLLSLHYCNFMKITCDNSMLKDWKTKRQCMTFGVATKIHTRLNAECRRTLPVFDL